MPDTFFRRVLFGEALVFALTRVIDNSTNFCPKAGCTKKDSAVNWSGVFLYFPVGIQDLDY